jgi:hypothetical protein
MSFLETPEQIVEALQGYKARTVLVATTGGNGKPSRRLELVSEIGTWETLLGPYHLKLKYAVIIDKQEQTFGTLAEAAKAYCEGI